MFFLTEKIIGGSDSKIMSSIMSLTIYPQEGLYESEQKNNNILITWFGTKSPTSISIVCSME